MRQISHNVLIRRAIVDLDGLRSFMRILDSLVMDIKAFAAETIANVAKVHRARRSILQQGGISKLVSTNVPQSAVDFQLKSNVLS